MTTTKRTDMINELISIYEDEDRKVLLDRIAGLLYEFSDYKFEQYFTEAFADNPDMLSKYKMMKTSLIGYQIEDKNGTHEIPTGFYSFEVLSKKTVTNFFKKLTPFASAQWKIVPIYEGDVEEPTFIKE